MRKQPYTVGSYIHVIKRGSRGLSIVRDNNDRWRFLLMLRHFNDSFNSLNWFRDIVDAKISNSMIRPDYWPKQNKIVKILGFCLVENHFHLLLQEIVDGGVAKFMQRLGIGMANHFNQKYNEKGCLFQGAYRSRTVDGDNYLRYVSAYIMVKNSLELYPKGGLVAAAENFDEAFQWASSYPFCSLGDYVGDRNSLIVDRDILGEIFTPSEFKFFSKDFIEGFLQQQKGVNNENKKLKHFMDGIMPSVIFE
ncbi:MAG: hypothetical protein A3G03_02540 [Candidatus Taylorbacteria bacterium RIFCSPLOWO2_12_FULL_44_15c]|uniref:Transposase IS200-like domain-containing protein n=1 Tax=Candidatus Taylorbacteria bacterium RIFCSPLOWO2_12_FULL_44_15c TaxID=1802333 RepID=A0A1G2P5T1_9BACT|nr:MAG: hypothetical protein A3I97_01455 [Candidatus Taylorbacteria bacterium RIFCSPLOWO2_02_FULL_44_35]OHA43706.1 MAG: hypothetical protein A3G03_02540 [Candidatus Taylorbacteria bacterium RIFCSPLOWO2_12_FULL_44_15c]